jgi:hypothetical protein
LNGVLFFSVTWTSAATENVYHRETKERVDILKNNMMIEESNEQVEGKNCQGVSMVLEAGRGCYKTPAGLHSVDEGESVKSE